MTKLNTSDVQKHATALGIQIVEDHIYNHTGSIRDEGYWLQIAGTDAGVWDDDNFCTSLEEVAGKLTAYEIQQQGTAP